MVAILNAKAHVRFFSSLPNETRSESETADYAEKMAPGSGLVELEFGKRDKELISSLLYMQQTPRKS